MKFEATVWVVITPIMAGGEIKGAKITNMYKRPTEGSIKLSISVPETFFRTPEIRVSLKERDPEVWEGHEVTMSDAESRSAS